MITSPEWISKQDASINKNIHSTCNKGIVTFSLYNDTKILKFPQM